jgi:hypothetical protein
VAEVVVGAGDNHLQKTRCNASDASNQTSIYSPAGKCRRLLYYPRMKRPRPSTSKSPTSIRLPDPSSIYGLMREHSRERLYVRPLHWTSQHMQLLECRFILEEAEPQKKESSWRRRGSSGNANQSDCTYGKGTCKPRQNGEAVSLTRETAIRVAADGLRCLSTTEFKISAVRQLLEMCGFHRFEQVPLMSRDVFC